MSLLYPTMISSACPSISSFKVGLLSSRFCSGSSLSFSSAALDGGSRREGFSRFLMSYLGRLVKDWQRKNTCSTHDCVCDVDAKE